MTDIWNFASGLATALVAGAAFGALYFALLWHTTKSVTGVATGGGPGALRLFLGFVLRLAFAGGALVLAIRAGADAAQLLAAVLGFTFVRQGWIRYIPRQG